MSSPAKLPTVDARDRLADVLGCLEEVIGDLDALAADERWDIWNRGGEPFGRPQAKGPGEYTAKQFVGLARHLYDHLERVEKSFAYREGRERERRAARRGTPA